VARGGGGFEIYLRMMCCRRIARRARISHARSMHPFRTPPFRSRRRERALVQRGCKMDFCMPLPCRSRSGVARPGSLRWRSKMLLASSAAFILAAVAPASAIVINNAFNPSAPPVVDTTNQFPNVLALSFSGAVGCTGTLISPSVVLTAAHCFFNPNTGLRDNTPVSVGGQTTSAIYVAPGYTFPFIQSDLAVLALPNAITNVPRSALQLGGNPIAQETPIYIVGYGNFGTGTNPPTPFGPNDGQRRKAQTNIGAYLPISQIPDWNDALGASSQNVYLAQFRDPANPNLFNVFNLSTPPPMLQGGIAPGDSGGPMFYCPAGALNQCTTPQLVQIGEVFGEPLGRTGYGQLGIWNPTALFADWISSLGLPGMLVANAGIYNWSDPGAWRNGAIPGSQDVAWLVNQGSITLNTNAQVDSLWISGGQSWFIIPPAFALATTTNTNLAAGMLSVNGILSTPFLYMSGGVLNGAGTITGPGTWVANVGGVVAPGTASGLGTLTIQGSYFQGPSGELQVRLAGIGNDRLTVTGQALLGGTLVTLLTSSPLTRQYTVLHADGGLGGLFSTALCRSTCHLTFLQPSGMAPPTSPGTSPLRWACQAFSQATPPTWPMRSIISSTLAAP